MNEMNFQVTEDQRSSLHRWCEAFLRLNTEINLSAARDFDTLWTRHVEDSLQLMNLPEVNAARSIVDLGTGGGFPGIPLAICRPETPVTLMDSVQKKLRAIESLAGECGVKNIEIVAGRAEDLAHDPGLRFHFDLVVARAVAPLPVWVELAAGFVRPGGHIVAMKGTDVTREIEDARGAMGMLGLGKLRLVPYPMGDLTFHLVVMEMLKKVPSNLPRGVGIPAQRPLSGPRPEK